VERISKSAVSGPKSGQSDRKGNSSMTNVECRLIRRRRIELRNSFYFIYSKIAERSDIHNSSIDNHHSSFDKVSYKVYPPTTGCLSCFFRVSDYVKKIANR
jgi:hypothetical protein